MLGEVRARPYFKDLPPSEFLEVHPEEVQGDLLILKEKGLERLGLGRTLRGPLWGSSGGGEVKGR
ncbi:hypothetical protein [Thermus thalpophilus]|uniref:hypothetical protein n=1 Tax=Thermus thalpophilus TaxID=2908147 RepID=UPI001FAA9930|nr:hypothetical protein [Thermus thalpophilus]